MCNKQRVDVINFNLLTNLKFMYEFKLTRDLLFLYIK